MRMRKILLVLLAIFSETVPLSVAQTPIAQLFNDMKSSDAAKAKKAREDSIYVLKQEFPTIEKDAPTICGALSDPDSYIRLQATGILSAVVRAAPSHNQLVLACVPGLLVTAKDSVDRVRDNSLFTLAMNPAGPPPEAHQDFLDALNSDDLRSVEYGAAGLLKEGNERLTANQELVAKAVSTAADAKHKLSFLYAISGTSVKSQTLFDAARSVVADPDPDVQEAAVDAVVASSTDKVATIGVLQEMKASASTTEEVRWYVNALIISINKSH